MTIARKPKGRPQASESKIAALIDKGGSTRPGRNSCAQTTWAVALRIPGPLADRLTRALEEK